MIKKTKKNKGFILIMTLVMAMVMLIICFVCLKIFLAPYVAIQSDIIKKKEFYMADTAIEVIREQISNIFYIHQPSEEGWENLNKKYAKLNNTNEDYPYKRTYLQSEENLKKDIDALHDGSQEVYTQTLDESIEEDKIFIAKYSGDLFCKDNKNTLPSVSDPIKIIPGSEIKKWNKEWKWGGINTKPSVGINSTEVFSDNNFDNDLEAWAWIKQVKINNDVKISTENTNSGDFYNYTDIINNTNLFLPKELQGDNSKNIIGNDSDVKKHIRRRDYVIIATATHKKSYIKFRMEYYFSLISYSPIADDIYSDWDGSLVPRYRLYFRKLNYYWTEEED